MGSKFSGSVRLRARQDGRSDLVLGRSQISLAVLEALSPPPLPFELKPLDWWPDRFFNADAQYLYGHSSTNALDFVRVDKATRARTVIANPFGVANPRSIRAVYASKVVAGLVFVAVGESSQTAASMVIWRSADYGSTWTQVLTLGSALGGTINGVWCLSDRNICEVGGKLYIAEYNVNAARVNGGANDLLVLWGSSDNGQTFAPALTWNTGGQHQVRHMHCIKPTPSGKLLMLMGDTDAESAMILWDRVTDISNTAYSALAGMGVPCQYGNQRCRAVEATLVDGFWWYMSDGSNEATDSVGDVGWLQCAEDLSTPPRRLDGKISAIPKRDVYFACDFSNGSAVYIEEITGAPSANFELGLWVTNEDRTRIERTGRQLLPNTVNNVVSPFMFQYGDVVYVSWISAFGKGGGSGTASFTIDETRRWCGVRPDVIHPVYWVDPVNGVDDATTERGFYPGKAFKTLKYALETNRIPQGARVLLPAGTFTETLNAGQQVALNADLTNAEAGSYLTVEGAGKNLTKHMLSAGSAVANTFSMGLETCRFEFKDIHLSTLRDVSTQAVFSCAGAAVAQTLQFVRARVGGRDLSPTNQIVSINSSITANGSLTVNAYDTEFAAITTGAAYLITGDVDGPVNVNAYRCVFDGGRGAFNPLSTDTIYAEDSLFTNYTVAAMRLGAAATKVPTTKRCRFHSLAGLPQLIDDGAQAKAGQFVAARCTSPMSPSALFDATSRVDTSAAPADPRAFDYASAYAL